MKKQMKVLSVLLITLLLLISGCTQSPLEPNEEEKDYVKDDYMKQTYDVELANYEFEERLNSFYESEPITMSELSDLYDDNLPSGSTDPRSLRVHWEDARQLALAEVELQKDILDWDMVDLSERPILVLDREGGDFYRYYEYRVSKNSNEIGAVRIPAYRRTENFSTAEVHKYLGNGKYTIETTAWSGYIMSKIYLDKDTEFYKDILADIRKYITEEDENMLYNILYRMNNSLGVAEKRDTVTHSEIRDMSYATFNKHRNKINISGMDNYDKDVLVDAAAQSITVDMASNIDELEKEMYKSESTVILLEKLSPLLIDFMHEQLVTHFLSGIQVSIFNMASISETNTTFRNHLKDMIWKHIESKLSTTELRKYLFNIDWNIFKEMDILQIQPIVEYSNINKYPKRLKGNSVREFVFTEFVVLEDSLHNLYLEYSTGLDMPNNKKTSLSKFITGGNEKEFTDDIKSRRNVAYSQYKNSRFWAEIGDAFAQEFLKAIGLENDAFSAGDFADLISAGISAINPYSLAAKLIVDTANYFINKEINKFQNEISSANDKLNTAISNLEKELTAQGKTLDDSIDMLDEVIVKAQQHNPRDEDYINKLYLYRKILQDEISGVGGTFEHIARNAYNLWMVWIVKPFIAYQHPDEWGPITWQYNKGWPFRSTLDLNRYLGDKKPDVSNKEVPEDDREINTVPEPLIGKCDNEWKSLDKFLQENLFNKDGKIYNISDAYIINIYEALAEDMLRVYINNIVFNDVSSRRSGLVNNPTPIKKDEQSKYNINLIIDDFNKKYNITLPKYIGFNR